MLKYGIILPHMSSKIWIAAIIIVAVAAGFAGYYVRGPAMPQTVTSVSTALSTTTVTYVTTTTKTVTTTASYYPITVKDALNRTITLAGEPATIVSLAPSITQMLIALGLCNRIIGLDQFSYQLLKELNLTSCLPANAQVININAMSPTGFNGDAIILLRPDIVLADSGIEAMWANNLQKLGVTVYFLNGTRAATYADIENDVMALGRIFDEAQRARQVVSWMERELRKYGAPVNATAVYIVWINPDGSFYAAGNNTFIAAEMGAAGGANAIGKGGWGPFEPSLLVVANPDVIVLGDMGVNCTYALKALSNVPGITGVAAYKNGRVYVVSGLAADAVEQPSLLAVYGAAIFHMAMTGKAPQCMDSRWFMSQFGPRPIG